MDKPNKSIFLRFYIKEITVGVDECFDNLKENVMFKEFIDVDEDSMDIDTSEFSQTVKVTKKKQIPCIRTMYIPEIVISIRRVLFASRDLVPGNLEKSIKLAEVCASDDYKVWKEFLKSGKLVQFLNGIRESCLQSLDKNKEYVWVS